VQNAKEMGLLKIRENQGRMASISIAVPVFPA
jgi:hypothetical protein